MGLPADRASSRTMLGINDIVIRGYLLSVNEGSEARRLAIGFGAGASELRTAVQDIAIETAVRRGRFEMSCPDATGTVLSSNVLEPIAWRGIERNEYTIGVSGCGRKSTYIVICPQTSDACVAGSGENRSFRGQ